MIGKLRERLVFEVSTSTVDSEGQPVEVFMLHATLWGRAEFLSGRELEALQKISAEIVLRFTVRYRSDITEMMRVSWRDELWNINAIMPDERKQYMTLAVSKVE